MTSQALKLMCWKIGKHKDRSDFDKGQIVLARRLGLWHL